MITTVLVLLVVTVLLSALFAGFGFRLRFEPSRSRLYVAVVTYVVSLVSVAATSLLLVMVIAGPHSGMMGPDIYAQITVLTGLLAVLIVPILAAYTALRRSGHRTHAP